MVDFENEIKKFQKIPETTNIEQEVYGEDLTDVTDLISQVINEGKRN